MTKVRVHELSKELGIQSKDLMMVLNDMGANVKNHMSTVEDDYVVKIRQSFPTVSKPKQKTEEKTKEKAVSTKTEPIKNVPSPTKAGTDSKTTTRPVTQRSKNTDSEIPVTKEVKDGARNPSSQRPQRVNEQRSTRPNTGNRPNSSPPQNRAGERPNQSGAPNRTGERPIQRPATTGPGQRPAQRGNNQQQWAQGQGTRPNTGSAPGRAARPGGNRPQGQGMRPNTGTTQGGRPGNRPQGQGDPGRNGGARNQGQNNRGGARNQGRSGNYNRSNNRNFNGGNRQNNNSAAQANRPLTNVKSVEIPVSITVKDFAQIMEVASGEVIKKLMGLGLMATINQEIDIDTATLVGQELGVEVKAAKTQEEILRVEEVEDNPADLKPRWPVVTIMGHVDHGKTSLLDVIRKTNVTEQEAGGITQHIGAYQVQVGEKKVTFLDTPGHEAFTSMRARGAQVTDIAILVVAADDGVMPQTVEAINHAKAAGIPIIVAINKMDKQGANPDRVKQELTEHELVPEEWGGETICVPVSAKTKVGIDNLLEMILLVAEMKELKANPNRPAKGTVIESQLDKGRGPVATVLVNTGTLHVGESIIVGTVFGRIRALVNDKGKRVKKAGPSVPVEIIGLEELPQAGDILYAVDEREARHLAAKRQQYKREIELKSNSKVTLDDLFSKIKEGEIKELKIVLKADVHGSVEAIRQSLERLSTDEVRVRVIHGGVGAIGESDVVLASASNAIIIGFNVRPDPMAKRTLEKEKVDIRLYRVIYNAIEDVQKAMEGLLEPDIKEVVLGRAEVRATFKVPKAGTIAGSFVTEGKITRNAEVRVLRDHVVIYEGKIESLKRFKDDVREVANGFECGIGVERFNDIKEGDIIEAFVMEEVKRTLGAG
jgi:translation initiation factor IF-2